jgi:ubiquinone/menaquinone biosynthesis C-methylase UbiE
MPITRRGLDKVLGFHELPIEAFEDATVFDLGCGMSDLGAELATRGIRAVVTGFDHNPSAFIHYDRTEASTHPVVASLDTLPVGDEAADVVLATYSLPMWGKDPREIKNFYKESQRVVKPGGLLSIFPIAAAARGDHFTTLRPQRFLAAQKGAAQIFRSRDWLTLRYDTDGITARKLN